MNRTPLLLETLTTRQTTRSGPVYLFRRPAGPPVTNDVYIDRWLHETGQKFDFTPLFNGDQMQARTVAQGYIKHLKDQAKKDGMDWDVISRRLKEISPHILRSLRTFHSYFDARLKTS